jgi:hypothetical protein
MLYAVLRFLDKDGNGQLDPIERVALHQGLANPAKFLKEQKLRNPHLRKVLASH